MTSSSQADLKLSFIKQTFLGFGVAGMFVLLVEAMLFAFGVGGEKAALSRGFSSAAQYLVPGEDEGSLQTRFTTVGLKRS